MEIKREEILYQTLTWMVTKVGIIIVIGYINPNQVF